jgi:hypothetical protein
MNVFRSWSKKEAKKHEKKGENIWRIFPKFTTFVTLSRKKEFIRALMKEL